MKTAITFDLDTDRLQGYTDQHIAALWHISQANPASYGDPDACDFAEHVAREIVRRFLAATGPELWVHQGRHVARNAVALQAVPEPMHECPAQARHDGTDIDELLSIHVQPGEALSMADLFTRFGLPVNAVTESGMRSALVRAGFRQVREATGFRRRVWVAPAADHQGCPPAPHTARDTQSSQARACHPQEATPALQTPETQPQAEQPGQIASHQSSAASPPPVNGKEGSLALEDGAA